MIAAPVQCDVDGVPKGSHYVSVPPIKVRLVIPIIYLYCPRKCWGESARSTPQVPFFVFTSPLQFQRSRSMRHLMPIVTPRLILRPPTLGDLDSIQTAKEEAGCPILSVLCEG
jgi:hypothetical protein